jgi:hypothetical protein
LYQHKSTHNNVTTRQLTWVPGVDWSRAALNERQMWPKCKDGRTGTNAFPYINAFSLQVPDGALSEQFPVDVELPDTCCIADDGWHVWTVVGGSQFRDRGIWIYSAGREELECSRRGRARVGVLVVGGSCALGQGRNVQEYVHGGWSSSRDSDGMETRDIYKAVERKGRKDAGGFKGIRWDWMDGNLRLN